MKVRTTFTPHEIAVKAIPLLCFGNVNHVNVDDIVDNGNETVIAHRVRISVLDDAAAMVTVVRDEGERVRMFSLADDDFIHALADFVTDSLKEKRQ